MKKQDTTKSRKSKKGDNVLFRGHWRLLFTRPQERLVLICFLGYLLITLGVIIRSGYEIRPSDKSMDVNHIQAPVVPKAIKQVNRLHR